jgi:16S rRNA (guanine527-N7)-methyltransferase
MEKLEVFATLARRWSQRINLVSRSDLTALWPRHIEDSLQLGPLLETHPPPALDLGSGAGFPGLILSIATGHAFHLVEADLRKAAFLREAIRLTGAPATVHATRIEDLAVSPVNLITARALAPLNDLLSLATPLLRTGGECLFMKGRTAETELTLAESHWHMRVKRWQSRTDADAQILQLSEINLVERDGL